MKAPSVASSGLRFAGLGWRKAKRRGPVTALDLAGGVLEIVQSAPRGEGAQITRWAVEQGASPTRMDSEDPKTTGRLIAEALQRLSIKPGQVVMGIPREQVFLRTLSLPVTDTVEEMAAMVHFQVSKDLPFPLDEAIIDFQIRSGALRAPVAGKGESGAPVGQPAAAVLVAVVRKQVIQRYHELAAAAGFQLTGLGLGPSAQARCVRACAGDADGATVGFVTLRAGEVSLNIAESGALVFSRTGSVTPAQTAGDVAAIVAPATASIAGVGGFVEAAGIEVTRSLHSFEGLGGHQALGSLWVAGNTGLEGEVAADLAHRFGIPCRRLDPVASLGLQRSQRQPDLAPLTALGLALSIQDPAGMPFDFLSPKRLPVPRNWRRIKIAVTAIAAAVCLLGCLVLRSYLIRQRSLVRDHLQAQVSLAEKNRGLYREMRFKLKTVQEWRAEKREWLDHYASLSALLPPCPEIYITSFSTGSRGALHLSIQARNGDVLAQLDKRLRNAGYDLKPLAVTPGSDKYGYPFQSSVELTLPDKLKIDLAKIQAPARPADDSSLRPGGAQRRTPAAQRAAPNTAPKAESAPAPTASTPRPVQPMGAPAVVQPAVVDSSGARPARPEGAPGPGRRPRRNRP